MPRKLWAGLDVGVETTSICVIDDAAQVLHEATLPTELKSVHRQIRFMKRRRFARVALEAGTGADLARGLRSRGYTVDIYESRQLSKFLRIRRNKTDAGDAYGIAQAARLGASMVSKVHLKSLECQSIASRLAIRRRLISSRIRLVNVLCRQLELFGGRIGSCSKAQQLRAKLEAQVKRLFGKAPNPLVSELRHLLGFCEALFEYQKRVDQELKRCALENDVCRRWMEIPGVGPICALTFYSAVGDPYRFRRASDIGSYLGLTPKLYQSGLTQRTGRISKMGHSATRALLVQASTIFMRCNAAATELHAWASRLEQRRGKGRARVALARKLATVMLAMWKSEQDYRPRLVESSS